MLSYGRAFFDLRQQLSALYDERECAAIAHEIVSNITGLTKIERLTQKDELLSAAQQKRFDAAAAELLKGIPLQYVTKVAWFAGRVFNVNPHVLIPRPETEELVMWVVNENSDKIQTILDVGTGSGCIAISLALALKRAHITACDISEGALEVAKNNAQTLGANVSFIKADFLTESEQNIGGRFSVIVSNPPYIPFSEKERLHINVSNNEPRIALFVPDEDALVFYRVIARYGLTHLEDGGKIYCELDAAHAEECKKLFEAEGYWDVTIKKDMFDNWRFISAQVS